jgi:Rrf2 family protein
MRLGEGVEWSLHTCLLLAWLDDEAPVPVARLAAAHELPSAYLNKHLQALARAGILTSSAGRRGGFRLARAPDAITLLDVVTAAEGGGPAFRCREIRQRGLGRLAPAGLFDAPCGIATAMWSAELAWRRELAARTVGDLVAATERESPGAASRVCEWYRDLARTRPDRQE